MKILIVGGGGREHALAWKLSKDDPSAEIIVAPGNAGIAQSFRCEAISATDVAKLLAFAEREKVELTVVGPEAPLDLGIADKFRAKGYPVFGPTKAAARIETSKRFAKDLMMKAGVPTARAEHFTDANSAKAAIKKMGAPIVIKASGIAAGKGVIVATTVEQAQKAVDMMLLDHAFGEAGNEILVEEFMEGEELSLFGITDGTDVIPLVGAQDHKRLLDNDQGPNTGGMGAYAPVSISTDDLISTVKKTIFEPTLKAMRDEGCPFTGLLYAGLMLTKDGPKVVEFNCRFGDPETQVVLSLMKSSLLDLFITVAKGNSISNKTVEWERAAAATTVLAAEGYPDSPKLGDEITFSAPEAGVQVFHAGTKLNDAGKIVTSGGRVLNVTAVAPTLEEAAGKSRSYAEKISFRGKQFRKDIGWRELKRA